MSDCHYCAGCDHAEASHDDTCLECDCLEFVPGPRCSTCGHDADSHTTFGCNISGCTCSEFVTSPRLAPPDDTATLSRVLELLAPHDTETRDRIIRAVQVFYPEERQ